MGLQINNNAMQNVPELRHGITHQSGDQSDVTTGGFRFISMFNLVAITNRSDRNQPLSADGSGPFRLDILVGEDRHRIAIEFPKDAAPAFIMGKLADAAREQGLTARISNTRKEVTFGNELCVVFDRAQVKPNE